MLGNRVLMPFHFVGTQAANISVAFQVPSAKAGLTFIGASLVGSNANDATFDLGTNDDPDGVVDGAAFGDTGVPALVKPDDFNGDLATDGQEYHFGRDEVISFSVDFDGAAGTAIDDPTIVLEFMEG